MKKIFSIGACLFLLTGFPALAQNYFQQEVNYQIRVRLDDTKHEYSGFEKFVYINHSKDVLNEIRMHLWPNAYSNNETALAKQLENNIRKNFDFRDEKTRGYIDSIDFKVNGENVRWKIDTVHTDIAHIYLKKPLQPGEQISISTPFHAKIPDGMISRMGHLGQSYQITQWYPKPAVYDLHGWNDMPYLNQGEFYSEYGSFDVSISLPKNYVVGATGELQDQEEINWLNDKAKKDSSLNFINKTDTFPASDKEFKTLHYKQSSVHDFAWFADKRYHVLKGEVELPKSKRKVILWSMFSNEQAKLWQKSIGYMHDAIYKYSLWVGDYPYSQCTAVYGSISAGGGMEYPTITVIGNSENGYMLDVVIAHEIGHNWFYGILGSNERRYPWMDEGINSYYENRYVEEKYKQGTDTSINEITSSFHIPVKSLHRITHKDIFEISYIAVARHGDDQAIGLAAPEFTEANYGGMVYAKTALVFNYLEKYLGKETFDKGMQAYFDAWKFKHPMPEDIKAIFEKATDKNLDWFFQGVINTNEKLDYKLSQYKKKTGNLKIENFSNIASPFSVSGIKDHAAIKTRWYDGFTGIKKVDFPSGDYDHLVIDYNKEIPEINRQNNSIRTKGLFKKIEPLQFRFPAAIENPYKTQIFYTPAVGWNSYDRWMAGLILYNPLFPSKNFEYTLMPLYGFKTKNLCGGLNISYQIQADESIIKSVKIGINASTFGYNNYIYQQNENGQLSSHSLDMKYTKFAPYLNIELRKKTGSNIVKRISLRSIFISEKEYLYSQILQKPIDYSSNSNVNEIGYRLSDSKRKDPWELSLHVQRSEKFSKLFGEALYAINYNKAGKAIRFRVFGGAFFFDDNSKYSFKMGGWNGSQDNLYDYTFIGRSETQYLPSKQFVETDGGFKMGTNIGRSNKWIAAMNIKIPFPGSIPGGLFADVGTYEGAGTAFPGSQAVLYDAGIMFNVGKIFEIYIPLTASSDILREQKINNLKLGDQIRFTFYLDQLNPIEKIRNISF